MFYKRPLVWFLIALFTGIMMQNLSSYVAMLVSIFLFLGCILGLIYLCKRTKVRVSPYCFLIFLPLFFIIGYIRINQQMKPASLDSIFDDQIEGTIYGKLINIEEKEQYRLLTLKSNSIQVENNLVSYNQQAKGTKIYKSSKLIVYSSSDTVLKIGNIVSVTGTIKKFQVSSNPGQFNEYLYYKIMNIDYKVYADSIIIVNDKKSRLRQFLYDLKNKISDNYQRILSQKEAGTLSAMILGDKTFLDDQVKELYKKNGISHILAISGLHVSLIGLSLYKLLRKLRIPIAISTPIAIFILFSYGILTNFSVSTNRAVVMLVVFMLGDLIGRTYDLISGASLSAIIILIQSPMQYKNVGFLLSFAAIFGIASIHPILVSNIPIKTNIMKGFCLSASIQLMTLPIILYYFFEFPFYSVFINIIILPLSSVVVLLAIISGIIGILFLPIAVFLIGSVHYILIFYELICNLALKLPCRSILVGSPSVYTIAAYYMILFLFLFLFTRTKSRKSFIILVSLLIIVIKPGSQYFNITFLDVGQGDSIVMRTPSKNTYLIDGGSTDVKNVGTYRIEPYLKYCGIWNIDYVIVTHTDNDHISGLKEIIENMDSIKREERYQYNGSIRIHHLVMPSTSLKDESYLGLIAMAKEKGIQVLIIEKGDVIKDGNVTITCLHPSHEYKTKSRNAYSTVLSVTYRQFDMLLTGDVEEDGERLVLKELEDVISIKTNIFVSTDYDVLKVAHHGSKYSTSKDFLNLIQPEFAIISCGKNNRYGHPHMELLERLEDEGSNINITADVGAVTIKTDGYIYRVHQYKQNKK